MKTVKFWVFFFLSMMMLTACGAGPERSRKPSDDWARGLLIGEDAISNLAMSVDEDGEYIHAVWAFGGEDGTGGLRYVQLQQGTTEPWSSEVIALQGQVKNPALLPAGDGLFHLLWAKRTDTSSEWRLWYAQIDREGQLLGEPRMISDPDEGVGKMQVVADGVQGVLILWDDAHSDKIFLTGVSALGEKQAEIRLVTDAGQNPGIAVGQDGVIHLSWMDEGKQIFYAEIADMNELPVAGEPVYRLRFGTGASLDGPFLGIAGEDIYLFWSVLNQSGLEAGTAKTEYLVLDAAETLRSSELGMLPLEDQPYEPMEGGDGYRALVPAEYVNYASPFIYEPVLVQNPTGEMALALAMQQDYRLDVFIQIAVAFLQDGVYEGYALATRTQAISGDPVLAADGAGNLHLLWRDGFSQARVFYTTTDPASRAVFDRPMLRDVASLILAGGMESLAGVLLFPLAFPWIFAGLVLVVIWRMARNDESIEDRLSQVILGVALIMYQASKVFIFPTMVDYVPFSAWVDVPDDWALPLRIGIPLLIFGAAFALAERLRRNKKSPPSTLYYYFVVVIVDTALTLAVYGVNFLGAY